MIQPPTPWHPLFEKFTPRRRFALDSPARARTGTCFTVASQKGGVGKTTTAVSLAAGLGLAGHKCLLLDFDPQANATSGVAGERRDEPTADSPLFSTGLESPGYLLSIIEETTYENLWLLPSNRGLADIELIHRLQTSHLAAWREQVASLKRHFDYILVDCPPSLGGLPTLALTVSDRVIVPVQCEYYAMEGLSQILPVIERLQTQDNGDLQIAGLLLTMYSDELDLSRDVVQEIESYFPDLVYRSIVPRDVSLAESASYGLPIYYYSPGSRGAWSYLNLTREVLQHANSQAR